jgi:hypothetical protein
MRRNLLLAILFCWQSTIFAQQTLAPERNLPRPGDEIVKQLPSKDTLRNVIRVKTVRSAAEKDGNSAFENVFWYARGYRYPVFETLRLTKQEKEIKNIIIGNTYFAEFQHKSPDFRQHDGNDGLQLY